MFKILFRAVFNPASMQKEDIIKYILKFGFIFILIRWGYYSILFNLFRDYKNYWSPFVKPPFDLSIEAYSLLQIRFSIAFGIILMSAVSFGLWIYLTTRKNRELSYLNIVNILGISYFMPFIVIQLLDKIILVTVGWYAPVIIPLHTIILIWEAISSVIIISNFYDLKLTDKIYGSLIQIAIWIALCAMFWR